MTPNPQKPQPLTQITSLWDFTDAGLQDVRLWLEMNPPAIPIKNILGFQQTTFPSGMLTAYAGASAPAGWLPCDGAAVSRTTYVSLFAFCGTAYGAGDGSTTFNVPDLRGRVAAGFAASGGHADVNALGNNDGVAAANRRPKHRHTVTIQNSGNNNGTVAQLMNWAGTSETDTTGYVGPTTGSVDSVDAPAYVVVNYIIKT